MKIMVRDQNYTDFDFIGTKVEFYILRKSNINKVYVIGIKNIFKS